MVEAFTEANSALEVLPLKDCSVWRLNFDRTDDVELTRAVERALGAPLPGPFAPSGRDPVILWQGPHAFIVLCHQASPPSLKDRFKTACGRFERAPGLGVLSVSGPSVRLHSDADRPVSGPTARVMRLAGIRVTLWWPDDAEDHVRIVVGTTFMPYLGEWLSKSWLSV